MASPQWPAPTIATGTRGTGSGSVDRDVDVRRVRDDVEHGRALLRLGDQRLDLLRGRVGVDVVVHLDLAESVPDLRVGAEDAVDVHVSLDGRVDRAELDLALLRDRGDARRQAASERREGELDRGGAVVLGGELERVVGLEGEGRPVLLLV